MYTWTDLYYSRRILWVKITMQNITIVPKIDIVFSMALQICADVKNQPLKIGANLSLHPFSLGIPDIWERNASITLQDRVSPEAAFAFPPHSTWQLNAFSPASHWRSADLHYGAVCQWNPPSFNCLCHYRAVALGFRAP